MWRVCLVIFCLAVLRNTHGSVLDDAQLERRRSGSLLLAPTSHVTSSRQHTGPVTEDGDGMEPELAETELWTVHHMPSAQKSYSAENSSISSEKNVSNETLDPDNQIEVGVEGNNENTDTNLSSTSTPLTPDNANNSPTLSELDPEIVYGVYNKPKPAEEVDLYDRPICRSPGGGRGVCHSNIGCLQRGGNYSSRCDNDQGVCCQFEHSCNMVSGERLIYYRNPSYPSNDTGNMICNYRVNIASGICGLRMDFLNYSTAVLGQCIDTQFVVLVGQKERTNPNCGILKGKSSTVPVTSEEGPVVLSHILGGSAPYHFNIRLTQIRCSSLESHLKDTEACGRRNVGFVRHKRKLRRRNRSAGNDTQESSFYRRAEVVVEGDVTLKKHESGLPWQRFSHEYVQQLDDMVDGCRRFLLKGFKSTQKTYKPFSIRWHFNHDKYMVMIRSRKHDKCRIQVEDDRDSVQSREDGVSWRILGGSETEVNEWPWQVALLKHSKPKELAMRFFCGGALITDEYVLTAAHCVHKFARFPYTDIRRHIIISIGDHDISQLEETKAVFRRPRQIIVHHNWDPVRFINDIAILQLDRPVVIQGSVLPACLPPPGVAREMTEEPLTITGWGVTSFNGSRPGPLARRLKSVEVQVVDLQVCNQLWDRFDNPRTVYREFAVIDQRKLCMGATPGAACFGDSGGPASYRREDGRYEVVGLTSYGPPICRISGLPSIYTRVSNYIDWIKLNTVHTFAERT